MSTVMNECKSSIFVRQAASFVDVLTRQRPAVMLRMGAWFSAVLYVLLSRTATTLAYGIAIALTAYVVTGGWKFLYVVLRTWPRDLKGLMRFIELQAYLMKCARTNASVNTEFAEIVRKYPDKKCFLHEHRTWTFQEVDEFSNRVANVFINAGYRKGDVVALFMESKPEFVCMWLGLSKVGICSSLINHNLREKMLIHSITISAAKALVFDSSFTDAVMKIQGPLNHDFKYYCYGQFDGNVLKAQSMNKMLEESSFLPPPLVIASPTDRLMYIFTSGTTGLPKPAIIHHARFIFAAVAMKIMFHIRFNDILYTPLPLYHSAGGMLGIGQAILFGSTVAIRTKFSASRYWEDCIKFNCTVSQYIGEICRYLLQQPPKETDRQHRVRVVFGNGLRPQIWNDFVKRFHIKEVGEFYGSTEGNANIVNIDNRSGAIGFVSRIAPWVYPVGLIKIDEQTGEPVRDKNGWCIRCGPGECGEFIGKIIKNNASRQFLGYVNKTATNKKIYYDVFRKGDSWFSSGDLLMMDDFGYIYFKDRLGDTFRWRGENVSTAEVEGVVIDIIGLKECTIYGVEVPGCEGRAGMAAILDEDRTLDLENLAKGVTKSLPVYARPLFVRIVTELDMTSTFKLKKIELQKKGILPNGPKDELYYMDLSTGQYRKLDQDAYENICKGEIRL